MKRVFITAFIFLLLLVSACQPMPKQTPTPNPQTIVTRPAPTSTPTPSPTQKPTSMPTPTLSPTPILKPSLTPSPALKIDKRTWFVPYDYKSLAEAVQVANSGDIIRLKGGTLDIGGLTVFKPLTIVGDGVDITVLKGTMQVTSSGVVIQRITISTLEIGLGGEISREVVGFSVSSIKAGSIRSIALGDINIVNSELGGGIIGRGSITMENSQIGITGGASRAFIIQGDASGRVSHNVITGSLTIGRPGQSKIAPRHTISFNSFTETASLSVMAADNVFENNDFLRGTEQVSDSGERNTWRSNFWGGGWDAAKPVPIKGSAKSVDRSPSPKPISGQGANKP